MYPEERLKSPRAGRENLLFLSLLVLATAVYLFRLGYSDIWIDESLSKALVRHSLPEMIRMVAHDSHPPLYFIALKVFTAVVGNNNVTIRLFSVLGAMAMLVLSYALGRRVLGRGGALGLSLLLLALPMPALYAHVARMYTWAAFLVLGVLLFADRFARERRSSDLVWLGLFSLAAAYTHYFSLMAAFWVDAALLGYLVAKGERGWRGVAVMGVAVLLAYLPWLFVLARQAQSIRSDFWIPPLSWGGLLTCYVQFFGGFYSLYTLSWVMALVFYGLMLAAVLVAFVSRDRDDRRLLLFALVGFHATILTAVALSFWFRPVLYPRYLMTIAPLLMVPPAIVLTRLHLPWPKAALLAGSLACGLFIVFSESSFSYGPNQQALRRLAQTHPEVRKILHLNEVTAGPLFEYGRFTWQQFYLHNAGTSWYSNMEAFDGLHPIQRLDEMVQDGEVFCLAEFAVFPLNGQNLTLVSSQCEEIGIEEISDEKSNSGVGLKLHILKARLPAAAQAPVRTPEREP